MGGKRESTSVSVPIFGERGEFIGVIVESGFAAAVSPADIKQFARDLKETAALIEQSIRDFKAARGK